VGPSSQLNVESEVESLELRQENELTLRDLVNVYRKRHRVIYGTVLTLGILCAIYCVLSTRRYEATGSVQIQKEASDGMGLDSLMSDAGGASDALEANIIIQTQASILESDTLAIRTIENLHMEGTEDFAPRWNPLGWIMELIPDNGPKEAPGTTLENSPERRRKALKVFTANLTVKPTAGTRLIEIDYLNPDPKLAAAVVNEITQGLIDYNFQTRFNATNQASTWLTGQLADLRTTTEDLQAKVVKLQRESGVYSLGTVDATGKEMAYSGVLDQLQQETSALSMAQQNRILKGAIAKAAESGDAETLSGLSGNTMIGTTSMANSMALIQALRQQESLQQGMVKEAEAKYGSSYPKLGELRANLEGIQKSIKAEVERVRERAESDSAVAKTTEDTTRKFYDQAKNEADKLNDKGIEYAIARQEAEGSRMLYEDLLKRLKEAGVLEGLKSSNITVVDPGRVPSKPKKPNIPVYMALAIGAGFFLGCLAALLVDTLDNKVSSIQEVEEITGQTILGATPVIEDIAKALTPDGRNQVPTLGDPHSTFAEAMRSIRTAVLLTGGADKSRVILLTSSLPGEGKTTISTNLAVVLAQTNRKVLLVDIDMRRGTLRHKLGLPASVGLSELLAGQERVPQFHSIEGLPSLDILQSGTPPPNPSELLDSKLSDWLLLWREHYDYIVLDGPPLLPVTDAKIVHPMADITLLLTRSGLTERAQLQRSFRILANSSKHFVGVIMNGLRPQDENYYGYYGYRKYSYNYGKDGDAKSNNQKSK